MTEEDWSRNSGGESVVLKSPGIIAAIFMSAEAGFGPSRAASLQVQVRDERGQAVPSAI